MPNNPSPLFSLQSLRDYAATRNIPNAQNLNWDELMTALNEQSDRVNWVVHGGTDFK